MTGDTAMNNRVCTIRLGGDECLEVFLVGQFRPLSWGKRGDRCDMCRKNIKLNDLWARVDSYSEECCDGKMQNFHLSHLADVGQFREAHRAELLRLQPQREAWEREWIVSEIKRRLRHADGSLTTEDEEPEAWYRWGPNWKRRFKAIEKVPA